MKNLIRTCGSVIALIPIITLGQISDVPVQTNTANNTLGQQEVDKLWADFAKPDLTSLDQLVAPGFQSLHEDGARDWSQERQLLAQLKLTAYALSDYKVTRNGDILLITYQCKVGETIAEAKLAKVSTPRMDVFQQINGEWRLLSHVNVRKLSPSSSADPMIIASSPE